MCNNRQFLLDVVVAMEILTQHLGEVYILLFLCCEDLGKNVFIVPAKTMQWGNSFEKSGLVSIV